jgi:hypothetical protein
MAWQELIYHLKSSAPLIMHNGQTADPLNKWSKAIKQISGKRNKTDADHEELARLAFIASLYLSEDGPIIPANNIESMLNDAAKKTREGKIAKAGVFCIEHARLEYDGPRTADELWADELFRDSRLVRVSTARIVRTRPIFHKWTLMVKLNIEDTVTNPQRVDDWMFIAGTQIGLGDFRPQYGRFVSSRID